MWAKSVNLRGAMLKFKKYHRTQCQIDARQVKKLLNLMVRCAASGGVLRNEHSEAGTRSRSEAHAS